MLKVAKFLKPKATRFRVSIERLPVYPCATGTYFFGGIAFRAARAEQLPVGRIGYGHAGAGLQCSIAAAIVGYYIQRVVGSGSYSLPFCFLLEIIIR